MKSLSTVLFLYFAYLQNSTAQIVSVKDSSLVIQDTSQFISSTLYDVVDLFQDINPLRKADTTSTQKTRSGISYLPNINYNPSIGFQIGLKAVGGVYLGDKKTTSMSIFATSANYTTRGIFYTYLTHDTYTKDNRWNLKGNLLGAKMVGLDYGLGIGLPLDNPEADEATMNNPVRNRYVNHYNVYEFSERLYRQLLPGMFVGGGIFFELKRDIRTSSEFETSPNAIYSKWNDFNSTQNNNNGLMFNLQYLTRDNPNSAYKGIYADVVLRMNQTWLGSQKNAYQLQTDFRKYWQLSEQRPNHVLAFWNYGSYNLGGTLFYLDLPGTGKDPYTRSGRGYTNGYFKGISFFYSEMEYRFPILKNQFLSGVVFANVQTANDQMRTKLFQQWQPAGGGGLRVLFNKMTRTNLCIDYAFGKFGQRGLFLGLNEAF
ncbi:BamA/TamA family outer membrane protein [Sphingobacterium lumbrici]|uniref:BamA/TamA family outer membrane protein n=1 Tax=Sphingobacterium lumbrici TaxID=2559600 RepID=UPI001127ECCA|nr:BamA/TamA family outer membrane protein [Sphingobacterium lumbrici]